MDRLAVCLIGALLAAAGVAAQAQSGGAAGPKRWGSGITPGWALMSPEEQKAHRERMSAVGTHAECKAVLDAHRAQMVARAAERGMPGLPLPRRDPCADLKP